MVIRVVPNGDERDKDVANGIKYAVNNGAKIINCSFGKPYSPQKYLVDAAIKYAESKNVLIIQAAGNDSQDIDKEPEFPSNYDANGNLISQSYITVGASTRHAGKKLVASYSNYGKKRVDIFAPGSAICSTAPNNKYDVESGTSFSSPVVAGIAALVWSYYPNFTAKEIKDIILESAVKIDIKVKVPKKTWNWFWKNQI